MHGEKIEFVKFEDDIAKYIANACNPAILHSYKVIDPVIEKNPETGVEKEIKRKKIYLVIDPRKLALLIGLRGKNVKLLSQLFDAEVEVITNEEASETKIYFEKAVLPSRSSNYRKQGYTSQLTNKFSETYFKYQNDSIYDVTSSIDEVAPMEDTSKGEQQKKEDK
jgi:transcription antitermination factor NusA-like protein